MCLGWRKYRSVLGISVSEFWRLGSLFTASMGCTSTVKTLWGLVLGLRNRDEVLQANAKSQKVKCLRTPA